MTDLIPLDAACDILQDLAEANKTDKCGPAYLRSVIALQSIPTIDPAAIRETALREAAAYLGECAKNYKSGTRSNETIKACGRSILALIGEKK